VSKSRLLFFSFTLLSAVVARAQLDIPLSNVTLAYPSISAVTIQLGGTTRAGLPTPFIIPAGVVPYSLLWFCMDPLQTIYYSGSGRPAGSELKYASTNPSDFDKWTPAAPGLNAARIQDLADLFTAYAPTRTNQLIGGALQIAVWEVVNEFDGNSFNLSTGQMRVSGNATLIATAQSMLDSLSNPAVQNHGNVTELDYLIDGTYKPASHDTVLVQDLVGFDAVPEPGSFAVAGASILLSLVGWKLRTQKRAKT
jgi:hypothetical protein